jgi:hypothetical protein
MKPTAFSFKLRADALDGRTAISYRQGEKLSAGDDSKVCALNLLSKMDLWNAPVSRFEHFIESRRLSLSYLEAMREGFAETRNVSSRYKMLIVYLKTKKRRQWFGRFLTAMADLRLSMAKGEHVS